MFRLVTGLALVFVLFHVTADALGSDRGQKGLLVALIVVTATLIVERVLLAPLPSTVVPAFRLPDPRGLLTAMGVSVLMIAIVPIAARVMGWSVTFDRVHTTAWTIAGLFAQAGIAEESLFRAYLFGHLRQGRSFRNAIARSIPPFALVHGLLFWTMPWPIAAASVVLAVVTCFPLAYLFELGGRTVWAPALLHAVIQGAVKIVVVSSDDQMVFPLIWMGASALVPLLVFAVPRRPRP